MIENLSYLSKAKGTGGEIKKNPWDFIVQEIDVNGEIYAIDQKIDSKWTKKEEFVVFILQKRNWTTQQALREVTKRLGMGKKRYSCAGSKDRGATTVQLASVFGADPDELKKVKIKDIDVLGAWYWDCPIKMGDLLGNKFEIRIPSVEEDASRVKSIMDETNGLIPNYFGEQRFGIRDNTHKVGKFILKGNFEEAVKEYILGGKDPKRDGEIFKEIKELIDNYDFKKALEKFPKHMKYEITLLSHLSEKGTDYIGALRKMPRSTLLMFVHAVQSDIFNQVLSQKIKEKKPGEKLEIEEGEYECSRNWYDFPEVDRVDGTFPVGKILGYASKPNKREIRVLEEKDIEVEKFKIKSIPEISSAGSYRPFLVPIKNFKFDYEKNFYGFELPAGSYATVAMREFLDKNKKN